MLLFRALWRVCEYLQEHNGSIRIPVNLVSLANRVASLQAQGQGLHSLEDIAEELGETPARLEPHALPGVPPSGSRSQS